MATTGTTAFNPPSSDLVLNALSRNQITGSQITTEHLARAAMEANLAMVRYGNLVPNLWTQENASFPLVQGTATYAIPATTVDIIILYLSVTQGGVTTDRVLGPVSTTEYNAYPNKTTQGPPSSYYFDRLLIPQITFWPVPDDTATYVCKYVRLRQFEDTSLKSGYTGDMPWRWLDAFSWELTARIAAHYKPDFYEKWQAVAERSWQEAAGEDTQAVNLYITPGLSSYYR